MQQTLNITFATQANKLMQKRGIGNKKKSTNEKDKEKNAKKGANQSKCGAYLQGDMYIVHMLQKDLVLYCNGLTYIAKMSY
jgi:hypothetical protein